MTIDKSKTVESNNLDRAVWLDLAKSLANYEGLMAELAARRAEIVRTERRIGLLGALLSLDGIAVKLPESAPLEISERLTTRIEATKDLMGKGA